ncbi:MAG: DNA polymerase III subunit beta [Ruminococcaceae bacterium]|nr:DNA polymerase III subunit beta [Oscillospiraceae bacterium]
MKIICSKTTLNEAVISVSKAVSSHSSLPVLEGIYISASTDGVITLISNDMEMGIEAKISGEVEHGGSTVLNAKILGSIVKNLPLEEVLIELDEKNICTIKSGNSKFEISGMNSIDFPDLPVVNPDYSVKIPKKTLKEMISKTIFCTSLSDNRPILKGCLFDIEGGTVRMVSTDGFRLAVRTYHLEEDNGERKFVVPAKALGEINKILREDDEFVEVNCTSKNAVFIFENYRVVTRLIEGDYINSKVLFMTRAKLSLNVLFMSFLIQFTVHL